MSSTMNVKLEIRDVAALTAAVLRMGGSIDAHGGVYKLFDDTRHKGRAVHLTGWRYPIVVDTETGKVAYDDYHGKWGNVADLNKLKGYYGVEVATRAARAKGYSVRETLENNKIVLHVGMGRC